MHPNLKSKLYDAIDKTMEAEVENNLWDGYIHTELWVQMMEAAALVFDSAMMAQEFAKSQEE